MFETVDELKSFYKNILAVQVMQDNDLYLFSDRKLNGTRRHVDLACLHTDNHVDLYKFTSGHDTRSINVLSLINLVQDLNKSLDLSQKKEIVTAKIILVSMLHDTQIAQLLESKLKRKSSALVSFEQRQGCFYLKALFNTKATAKCKTVEFEIWSLQKILKDIEANPIDYCFSVLHEREANTKFIEVEDGIEIQNSYILDYNKKLLCDGSKDSCKKQLRICVSYEEFNRRQKCLTRSVGMLCNNTTGVIDDNKKIPCVFKLFNVIPGNPKLSLALGAGVSMSLGADSWHELIHKLERHPSLQMDEMLLDGIIEKTGHDRLSAAQLIYGLYDAHNVDDYYWVIYESLYDVYAHTKEEDRNTSLIESIVDIVAKCNDDRNFRVITYNYDDFLEHYLDARGVVHHTTYKYSDFFNMDGTAIHHVHGYFPQFDLSSSRFNKTSLIQEYKQSIYLKEADYHNLYNDPYSWSIATQLTCYRENSCLIIGSSLTDLNIKRLLRLVFEQTGHKRHFAILTDSVKPGQPIKTDAQRLRRRLEVSKFFETNYGVYIFWVNTRDDIPEILQAIVNYE